MQSTLTVYVTGRRVRKMGREVLMLGGASRCGLQRCGGSGSCVDLIVRARRLRFVGVATFGARSVEDNFRWLVLRLGDTAEEEVANVSKHCFSTYDRKRVFLSHLKNSACERYLGCKQRIRSAVNDRVGLEPAP